MSEEEIQSDEPIIPEEDFRTAIAACRQDPELDRYFKFAPSGARLFIGLTFYSTHFGEKTDTAQYKACLEEIEPSLMQDDLKYLIRFERDKETKKYLKELLERRKKEDAAEEALRDASVTQDSSSRSDSPPEQVRLDPASPAPKGRPKAKIHGLGASLKGLKLVADAEPSAPGRRMLVAAIGAGVLVLFVLLFLVQSRVKVGQELERRNADVVSLQRRVGELQQELERTQSELRKVKSATRIGDDASGVVRARQDAPVVGDDTSGVVRGGMNDAGDVVPQEETDSRSDAGGVVPQGETPKAPGGARPGVKVVFTDGRSIVRKSGGKLVEVPRTFSYTGAGLKKPFWIYDRKLDEAKKEAEAKLERQARDAWRELADEAKRQERAAVPVAEER